MITVIAKYAFWIIICLPVIFAGCWFVFRLLRENKAINKELDEEKRKAEQAAMERSIFEISYKNKYSGDR